MARTVSKARSTSAIVVRTRAVQVLSRLVSSLGPRPRGAITTLGAMRVLRDARRGVIVIELERHDDERGAFARTFCERGVRRARPADPVPAVQPLDQRAGGTLRGMHFNAAPHGEAKLVRCVRGRDLRRRSSTCAPDSPTRFRACRRRAHGRQPRALFVPAGFAHGFLTLEDETDVFYQMGASYRPERRRGLRWDDPRSASTGPWRRPLMSAIATRPTPMSTEPRSICDRPIVIGPADTSTPIPTISARELMELIGQALPDLPQHHRRRRARDARDRRGADPARGPRGRRRDTACSTGPCPTSGTSATPTSPTRAGAGSSTSAGRTCTSSATACRCASG